MPDLKTELMKIQPLTSLNFDDEGENTVEVVAEEGKPSHTRDIWEYIKQHPGCNTAEITQQLPNIDNAGVSTRLNQLMRRGLITRSFNPVTGKQVNHVSATEFTSMSREDRMVRMREGRAAWVRQHAAKKARREAKAAAKQAKQAPTPDTVVAHATAPAPAAPANTDMSDVDMFVSRLTVADARNLYEALKRVFLS